MCDAAAALAHLGGSHCNRNPSDSLSLSPMPSLSVIVITRDEAAHIGDCLRSVRDLADEIVVVDSGSRDDTVRICRELGARVIETDWPGFGPQKNRALDATTGDWVFSIDADERVTPELAAELRAAMADGRADAYAVPRLSQFCGHWVHHSGWRPDYIVRLFRRGSARFSDNLVHESVEPRGPVARLKTSLLHYSYTSRAQVEAKSRQYAEAGARELRRRGKQVGPLSPALHGAWAFLRTLLVKRGILDGRTGFAIARMNAAVSYEKYRRARALGASA